MKIITATIKTKRHYADADTLRTLCGKMAERAHQFPQNAADCQSCIKARRKQNPS